MMKKSYRFLIVTLCSLSAVTFWMYIQFGDQNKHPPTVNIDALVKGDGSDHKAVSPAAKRPFKNIQRSNRQSDFDLDDAQAIANKLSNVIWHQDEVTSPSLSDAKNADLIALKSRYGSDTPSDIKYDRMGRVRGVYDSIATASFDYTNSQTMGAAIKEIGERHTALFGLGTEGTITGSKVTCVDDVCATKLTKSFYGLPAWDHEQTVSTKQDTIFGITGVFDEPILVAPRPYAADETSFRTAIARHFSVDSDAVRLDKAAELGIARLGGADYYAFRLKGVSVDGSPYDIFVDAETGNVSKALTLVYESAVSASGTALDGSTVSFQANQYGSFYQMIDSRFPLGYETSFYIFGSDSFSLIETDSPNSGWPASAVSALAFTEQTIDYFKDNHNFDAVNLDGAALFVGVDLDEENASFQAQTNTMIFGVGQGGIARDGLSLAASKDVVGHEITHGIVATTSGLNYEFQSGALNESFSDFFGSMIDGDDWYIGEDLQSPLGNSLRNMANPADAISAQPTHFSEYRSLPKTNDQGGVHLYSGIPNRALYLLAEGLSIEGLGSSIGREKAANLAFKTMASLTPSATFDEAAEYMTNLARVEYASTPETYESTVLAWQSVGLPQDVISESTVSTTEVSPEEITAVTYLQPYYSTSDVSPSDNYYRINLQFFINSNPEFIAELNIPIITDYYAKFTRPVLIKPSDDEIYVFYQRKVDNSYYVWTGSNADDVETFLDDGTNIAGLDVSNASEMLAFSIVNTNRIVTFQSDGPTLNEIVMPSTAEGVAGRPVTYIDAIRFDPTGRFIVFDFFVCAIGEPDCSGFNNGNWSVGILDVVSGLVEFPFPSQPARFDLGFPAFSNLTDRYITLDVTEDSVDNGILSGVIIYDRMTGDVEFIFSTDETTEKTGAVGYPSFSADDTSIVYSTRFDTFEIMGAALLSDYKVRDIEPSFVMLNPSASFKAYATSLPSTTTLPSLTLSTVALDFGDIIQNESKSLQICLENNGSFPIMLYDSLMPSGFRWDGDNRMLSEAQSICSPVTASAEQIGLGAFSRTFSISHNGANSPTPISITGTVDIDTDLDGIGNNQDDDDDGDGTDDLYDAFPLDASEWVDTDGDQIGNNADTDDDGDGVPDAEDALPLDSSESSDYDNDGIGDNSDTDDGTWTYINSSGTISVTGCSTDCGSIIDLPSTIIGLPVTRIADHAFREQGLTGVTIPSGISSIGTSAFSNNALTTVVIPDSVVSISDFAFYQNASMGSVALPDGLISIGYAAFYNNALTSLDIPDTVISIGEYAFVGNMLATVSIPDSIVEISDYVFADNELLATVVLPDGLRSIGYAAFYNNALTSLEIPDTVTSIGDYSFFGNEPLVSISFSGDRPTLADTSFSSNPNLIRVNYCSGMVGWPGLAISSGTDSLMPVEDCDGDTVVDGSDAFPLDPFETLDTDLDTVGNNADIDDDNDSVLDADDAFPLDASESVDTDGDEIGNNADPDDDNDLVADGDDAFPLDASESLDTDGDQIGNNADPDDDNDSVADVNDAFPLDASESLDTDGDQIGNNADPDDDNDSVADVNDAFPLDASEYLDTDGDQIGNNADPDDDNDSVADVNDTFPLDASESLDTDSDGVGNNADVFPNDAMETTDLDEDLVGDNSDNCVAVANFDQLDTDSDLQGDACDQDDDNDGLDDQFDAFPIDPTEQLDTDGDGVGDNSDAFFDNALYVSDADSDGMPDAWETRYGLDPNDASDATSDQDNDGVSALDEFLAGTIPSGSLDIDGNAQYDALTDGLLLLRGMFGLDGSALVTGTIASDATYTESVDIESRIETLGDLADIDGNGDIDALTDGLLTLRYLFGLRGDTLINGVVADDATRKTAEEIEAHLETLMPAL